MFGAVSLPGILITILVLGVLITVHEAGHFLAAKSLKIPVKQFAIGFGPRVFGFVWGETECRLNWIPLGGYCAFVDDTEEGKGTGVNSEGAERLLRARPVWQRVWVVSAGVIFNAVFAWILLFGMAIGIGVPTGQQTVAVQRVLPGSAALTAGLQPGDRLTTVGGEAVADFKGFASALKAHAQQPTTLTVERAGKTVELTATPNAEGKLGFAPMIDDVKRRETNPLAAAAFASQRELQITQDLWGALSRIVTQPQQAMGETGGPIAIVAFGDQIFQVDPLKLFDFAVLLSIELAIINILPLPALDGGHLLMLAIEAVRGKPLPRRVEEGILTAGFMLIMGLGVLLILKDIVTLPGMYGR